MIPALLAALMLVEPAAAMRRALPSAGSPRQRLSLTWIGSRKLSTPSFARPFASLTSARPHPRFLPVTPVFAASARNAALEEPIQGPVLTALTRSPRAIVRAVAEAFHAAPLDLFDGNPSRPLLAELTPEAVADNARALLSAAHDTARALQTGNAWTRPLSPPGAWKEAFPAFAPPPFTQRPLRDRQKTPDLEFPELRGTLEWIHGRVERALRNRVGSEKLALASVFERAQAMLERPRVSYQHALRLALDFTYALSQAEPRRDQLYTEAFWALERLARLAPELLLIPAVPPVDYDIFVRLRPYPVFLLGLTDRSLIADRRRMSALEYLHHDLLHTLLMLREDVRSHLAGLLTHPLPSRQQNLLMFANQLRPAPAASPEALERHFAMAEAFQRERRGIAEPLFRETVALLLYELLHEDGHAFNRAGLGSIPANYEHYFHKLHNNVRPRERESISADEFALARDWILNRFGRPPDPAPPAAPVEIAALERLLRGDSRQAQIQHRAAALKLRLYHSSVLGPGRRELALALDAAQPRWPEGAPERATLEWLQQEASRHDILLFIIEASDDPRQTRLYESLGFRPDPRSAPQRPDYYKLVSPPA